MTLNEAVRRFVNDFNHVPTELIKDLYRDKPEELICLNSDEFMDEDFYSYWPCAWGTMFAPKDFTDLAWMKKNTELLEQCGFVVYWSEYYEILLGLNGGGYDFYEEHWKPLYLARGLHWHKEKEVG